jgi:hypothetical protein
MSGLGDAADKAKQSAQDNPETLDQAQDKAKDKAKDLFFDPQEGGGQAHDQRGEEQSQ